MYTGIRRAFPAAVLLALFAQPAIAQWSGDPSTNMAVTRASGFEQFPEVASDGAGGAFVAWQVNRAGILEYDLRLARLDALGFILWSMDIASEVRDQRDHHVIADGAGGAIVVWTDNRDAALDFDIYAQRVDGSGHALWGTDGVAVCDEASIQAYARAAPDGAGGAVIAWRDSRHYSALGVNIYAQRVNASGAMAWAADGVPVCAAFGDQVDPGITATGSGEFVIAWADGRSGSTNLDVAAQKLDADGVPQWAANGVVVPMGASQRWYNDVNPVLSDGAGGAFVVFEDDAYGAADVDLHVTRFAADGSAAWSPPTRVVCTAVGIQRMAQPIAASGGVVVPWIDWRYGSADPDVYAQRVDGAGAALWGADGRSIAGTVSAEADPVVIRERGGSLFFAWTEDRGGDPDLWARRHAADGTPLWTTPALACDAVGAMSDVVAVLSGDCGAILAWRDDRWVGAPPPDNTSADIYAQRVWCDGSLLQRTIVMDAPNGGETWNAHTYHLVGYHGLDIEGRDVLVEYTTNLGATWSPITTVINSGMHHVFDWWVPNVGSTQCLVRASVVGSPAVADASNAPFTIVLDPAALESDGPPAQVMLAAAWPNPARARVAVTFGLPAAGAARLEVIDASGRRVARLHDGLADAGWHHCVWAVSAGVRPGLYWLVLHADGRTLSRRIALLE